MSIHQPSYLPFDADVEGGTIHGGIWNASTTLTPTVLAIHGITASHLSWPYLAAQVDGASVVAPDLRGRGRSNSLPGPYGLPRQADDLAALLDRLGVDRVVTVGHSMGAFVAVWLAHRHPDRVSSLVLVDGGLPIPRRDDVDPALILGPAAERLSQTFPSRAAYREFWRMHPAFAGAWTPELEAYVDYDLDGDEPVLRPSTRVEAMAENVMQLNGSGGYTEALTGLTLPIDFLRAPRGLQNGPTGLYAAAEVAGWAERMPTLTTHEVGDVNHYTIVMSDQGVGAVASVVRAQLRAASVAGVGANAPAGKVGP
ncbi:alpha/beta fold hydrolase [Glaciibacter sp. 2TAF33]|uniref:alpha/beta fold hydrolase n=1 Tax=Glaciibacter sp. 2TAF33 TaxID=3233015 RepID=UPI003F8F3D70